MRRSSLFLAFPVVAAVAAACSGDRTSLPSEPRLPVAENRIATPCRPIGDDYMEDWFAKPFRPGVILRMAHIHLLMKQGKVAQAQAEMFLLWDLVLKAFYAGQLKGGMSVTTQNAVLQFGQLLYCMVGLDGSGLALGDPLGTGNVTQVVFPSPNDQEVVHGSQNASIHFFGNTVPQAITVTISTIATRYDLYKGPLFTRLDQFGPYFEMHIVPNLSLPQDVVVSQCIVGPAGNPPHRTPLAHNVGNGIVILPFAQPFLNCAGIGQAEPSFRELFARRDVGGVFRRLGANAMLLVTPEDAWATGVSQGGKTKNFSPFGGVDTSVVEEAVSALSQFAPDGGLVAAPPTVLVRTAGAHTPLDGATVTFTVTAGGGKLTAAGNPALVDAVAAITGLAGTAAVGSWKTGTGANTVSATAAFPAPATGSGVTITGGPSIFSATSEIIPWQGAGYRYSIGGAGGTPGFEVTSFDDSQWSPGQAAFGSGPVEGTVCPLDATVNAAWPSGSIQVPSDLLLRHSFTLPAGWANDLTLSIAIDNDIQVFVNGTDVTGTVSPAATLVDGLVQHEGCAARGSSTFTLAHALLSTGTNVLAIRARDRGVVSLVDAQLTVTPPSP